MIATLLLSSGCSRHSSANPPVHGLRVDDLAIVLVPHQGTQKVDLEIRRVQEQVRAGKETELGLERLGWLFVRKARESFDPGFYTLAGHCAGALEDRAPCSPTALLLRGHVLHNLHRFKEAEPIARVLVARRGLPFDLGLLSDVLMEQGKLDEAFDACQRMIDLRPDLHSYARGAHLRWLSGDIAGAEELMRLATSAATPLEAESAAWVYTRLAGYEFQLQSFAEAERCCAAALEFQKDYPPALLLEGRLSLALGNNAQAVKVLTLAAKLNPLPEYQWALAEALRMNGQIKHADAVEAQLRATGARIDPRTFSLFLATRGGAAKTAVDLASAELNCRSDVFTHDALAWALAGAGRLAEARGESHLALAQGTKDARLFLHAAVIAQKSGDEQTAQDWASQAAVIEGLLLPCERAQLHKLPLRSKAMARNGN